MTLTINNLRDVLLRVRYLAENAPDELKPEWAKRLTLLVERGREIVEAQQGPINVPPEPPPEPGVQSQVPDIARQLWALARGNPDIFQAYARSYPNDELKGIASNPVQLNALMNQINNTQSIPPLGQADGIQQAPLQSSNIFGTRYDPLSKTLRVRFQNGHVYKYDGVPQVVNDLFAAGEGTCRTSGRNKYGFWFRNKNPSMGAAFYNLIKLGKYPYQKIK